ncbi:DUF6473 family protein [Sulfitobacter sp. HNIBRBA3233]|uniref:DUF6473 family protein n=1 Tax=Sulfitobacter marinivivus TaxID=3158558 RepID=UPI0032DE7BA4
MTFDVLGPPALDYLTCRYGTSKLNFRGPERRLEGPYTAFLGGMLTFGRFIEQPFPLLVEHLTGFPSVNFGQCHAGPDLFHTDPVLTQAAQGARVTVIEVPGAVNFSNRFYSVHPRRNDRFLAAHPVLQRLYPEVDFTAVAFTQHLIATLQRCDPGRFDVVRKHLQRGGLRRMEHLLKRIDGPVVLLWLAEAAPPVQCVAGPTAAPRFVTRAMLDALAPLYVARVHVPFAETGGDAEREGKHFSPLEEAAAARVPGPELHRRVARALLPVLDMLP